jgi:hypothetical protein
LEGKLSVRIKALEVMTRRFPGQLLILAFLCAITFIPQLHITPEFQVRVFGWLFIGLLGLQRRAYLKMENKVIPPEDRIRSTDKKEEK